MTARRRRAATAVACATAVAGSHTTSAETPLVQAKPEAKRTKHRRRHRRHLVAHRPAAPWQTSLASFYDDAGPIACVRRASYGVAHRTLPCGTKVRLCVRHCVTAVVDDRGPYVGGREWDLSLTTAGGVGFPMGAGVAPVRWRLGG